MLPLPPSVSRTTSLLFKVSLCVSLPVDHFVKLTRVHFCSCSLTSLTESLFCSFLFYIHLLPMSLFCPSKPLSSLLPLSFPTVYAVDILLQSIPKKILENWREITQGVFLKKIAALWKYNLHIIKFNISQCKINDYKYFCRVAKSSPLSNFGVFLWPPNHH